jgi:hypothetical protein
LAADQGDEDAGRRLAGLKSKMKAGDLQQAQGLVSQMEAMRTGD